MEVLHFFRTSELDKMWLAAVLVIAAIVWLLYHHGRHVMGLPCYSPFRLSDLRAPDPIMLDKVEYRFDETDDGEAETSTFQPFEGDLSDL